MDLYKNWDNYVKRYNINKFYDVDKKQFLRELTNFVYSFANKYNLMQILNKLKTNINVLQTVNLNILNWKLVDNFKENLEKEFKGKNYKWYILIYANKFILKEKYYKNNKIELFDFNSYKGIKFGDAKYATIEELNFYLWDGLNEPETPEINPNTGKIKYWNINSQNKIKDFLNLYLDVIIQENIIVQQGGNSDY